MKFNLEENYKHFILVVLAPLVGIVILFTYAFLYVKDEINFIDHEVRGLNKLYKVQDIVFDIQRIRGLSSIVNKDQNCIQEIKLLKTSIKNKSLVLKEKIEKIKDGTHLKGDFLNLLDEFIKHTHNDSDFRDLSQIIHKVRLFIEKISYHSNLSLDPKLTSYVLIQTLVSTLPELIEYNGQIRGISSSIINNRLSQEQKIYIKILESKIKDKILQLEFNMKEIKSNNNVKIIQTIYENTVNTQNALLEFINKELLTSQKVMFNSNEIFNLYSNNIEFITLLYNANYKELNKILKNRVENKELLTVFIVLSAILSILFILFINILFVNRNSKYIEEIKLLSITDGMTKLYNRRHFDNEFEKQLKIQKRANKNLIFIIMDIDHFKQYNDIYGHQDGDDTLVSVSSCIKNDLHRPDDMSFRLGGEEFGVLCSNMNRNQALGFANRLKSDIEDLKIQHKKSTVSEYVTISMGLIVIKPTNINNTNELYKYADEALYKAKQNGRNQVSVHNNKL